MRWIPSAECKYRGYVSKDGKCIFIFNEDEKSAKETLLHEVVDLLITKLAIAIRDPAVAKSDEIYNIKEAVVEAIRKLIVEEQVIKKGSREEIIRELKRLGGEELIE